MCSLSYHMYHGADFFSLLSIRLRILTDIDIVHMDFLNDSRCICFLSNGMKQVAEIIQSILQCALDFRSVVVPNMSSAGQDGSLLNVAQVETIKEAFDQNIRQLYTCYLNS